MNDLDVIDRFLDTFSRYIDSGFGLLQPEVAYLSSTLVVIDITLAGLFWAMAGEDVMARLIKKVLYIGAFAFIIGNFNFLAGVIFKSFAGLGLKASAASISSADHPGGLYARAIRAVGAYLLPGREGAGQRGRVGDQDHGARRDRRHRHGPV